MQFDKEMFTRKLGPLPVWAWALIIVGVGYAGYALFVKGHGGAVEETPDEDTEAPASDDATSAIAPNPVASSTDSSGVGLSSNPYQYANPGIVDSAYPNLYTGSTAYDPTWDPYPTDDIPTSDLVTSFQQIAAAINESNRLNAQQQQQQQQTVAETNPAPAKSPQPKPKTPARASSTGTAKPAGRKTANAPDSRNVDHLLTATKTGAARANAAAKRKAQAAAERARRTESRRLAAQAKAEKAKQNKAAKQREAERVARARVKNIVADRQRNARVLAANAARAAQGRKVRR